MWDMPHHRPLGDQMSGMGQYPFPPRKPQQELSPGGGRKNLAAIGPMKKNKMGFEDPDDEFSSAGMYFNQSVFPPHRPEKDIGPPHTSSQPGSHLGNLYGNPSGPQSNFYGSGGLPAPGMPPNMNSMQVHPGSSTRGISSQQHQFGRSLSHPGQSHHSNHLSGSVSTSGVPNMPSSLHGIVGSQGNSTTSQAGRGILSMGPRGVMGQVPPTGGHIGSQSGLGGLPKTSRTAPLTSTLSSPSRSSPIMGMPLTQSPSQPLQSQHQRYNFGSSSAGSQMGGFGLSRSQSVSSSSQLGSSFQVSGSLQSLTSAFGPPGHSDGVPPGSGSLDLSDFPVLANRVRQESNTQSSGVSSAGLPSRPSYGVVSKPLDPTPDFSIHNEDFPALPGSSTFKSDTQSENSTQQDLSKPGISAANSVFPGDMQPNTSYEQALKESREARFSESKSQQNSKAPPRGIQTSTSGAITNIPKGMVTDQFGMIGLLTFIRAAETEPNLVLLALGSDLTTLGLNLNSPESLYHTFGSPFADSPSRPHEIDYHVPAEYRINSYIRDKLAPIKLSRYAEDLLFYIYYTNGGDILQLAAAAELYARDWRYHKDERVWLTRVLGVEPQVKTNTYERGTYYFFDCNAWRKVAKEFHLEYDKLEEKPALQSSSQ